MSWDIEFGFVSILRAERSSYHSDLPIQSRGPKTALMKKRIIFFACVALGVLVATASQATLSKDSEAFVRVSDTAFIRNGKPYRFMGANFWQAMNLAARPGGIEKLRRELDSLQAMGIRNLRILALSQGPETEPWRAKPVSETDPSNLNESLLVALDHVLAEMAKRDMTAVMVLNNFWPWSGGMAQYQSWFGGGSIPYPPPSPGGSYDTYQAYTAKFFSNEPAIAANLESIRKLIERKNSVTNRKYSEDPTIFSWQLCNEPRGYKNREAFLKWIPRASTFIHEHDPNHLVSLGSEGNTPWGLEIGNEFVADHQVKGIDYTTAHIWAQNWDWYDPKKAKQQLKPAIEKMRAYFIDHVKAARSLKKPLIIEEFGLARDQGSFDSHSSTDAKNRYYSAVFGEVLNEMKSQGSVVQGVNFWAWSGDSKPALQGGAIWQVGDPLLGDPPHEPQGWYGVYSSDIGTVKVIRSFARKIERIQK